MVIKAENSRRIKELEEEFAGKEIAEFLRFVDEDINRPEGLYQQKRKTMMREIIVAVTLAACIAVTFLYLLSIV